MAQLIVDPMVERIARQFGGESVQFPRLVQSIINAEGGSAAIIKAVQCSIPGVTSFAVAVQVLCRSIVHHQCDWIYSNGWGPQMIADMAQEWAPQGATNDPTDLNKNWPVNVARFWLNTPTESSNG